jgi:hypothetical protein
MGRRTMTLKALDLILGAIIGCNGELSSREGTPLLTSCKRCVHRKTPIGLLPGGSHAPSARSLRRSQVVRGIYGGLRRDGVASCSSAPPGDLIAPKRSVKQPVKR